MWKTVVIWAGFVGFLLFPECFLVQINKISLKHKIRFQENGCLADSLSPQNCRTPSLPGDIFSCCISVSPTHQFPQHARTGEGSCALERLSFAPRWVSFAVTKAAGVKDQGDFTNGTLIRASILWMTPGNTLCFCNFAVKMDGVLWLVHLTEIDCTARWRSS